MALSLSSLLEHEVVKRDVYERGNVCHSVRSQTSRNCIWKSLPRWSQTGSSNRVVPGLWSLVSGGPVPGALVDRALVPVREPL